MSGRPSPATRLLERDAEVARLREACASAASGHGNLVLLEGPAGIGKSALLGATREVATGDGLLVLRAHGAQLEQAFPFGVVRQLFEPPLTAAGPERADILQGPAGVAARLLALPGTDADADGLFQAPADASFAVLHGLYWLTANLAGHRPLLLAVDDAHWADASSLRFLAFLLPRLEELPVTLAIAARDDARGELYGALATEPSAVVIRPAPLGARAVEQMLIDRFSQPPDPAFVAACLRATGGTPFLLQQLVAALLEDRIAPVAAAAPQVERLEAGTVARWILLRLGRLSAAAGRLARAVAILELASVAHAAALAGLPEREAAAAADELEAAGILAPGRPLAFAHPIVRASILRELPRSERSSGHRRAASLLAQGDAGTAHVADHLLATEPAGDPWVVEQLQRAASASSANGAPDSTVAYLLRALDEPPGAGQRPELLVALGTAEMAAGRPEAMARLEAAYASTDEAMLKVVATQTIAAVLGWSQRNREAVEVIDRAAAALGHENERLLLTLEIQAVTMSMVDARMAPAAEARIRALRERADSDATPPPDLLAFAAWFAAQSGEPAEHAGALARRALAAAPPRLGPADVGWFSSAVTALGMTGRQLEAIPTLDAAIADARALANLLLLSLSLTFRAWMKREQGDLLGAEGDAQAGMEIAARLSLPMFGWLAASHLAPSLVEQGRLDEAEAVLRLDFGVLPESQITAALLHARGQLRLAQRRYAEALDDALAAGRLACATLATGPNAIPWRSRAALAHLALGDVRSACALADEELRLARACGVPSALGIAACTAGKAAGGERGETLLREAVEILEPTPHRLEHARARFELGAALRRGKRRSEARGLLAVAIELATECRATPLAIAAHDELVTAGAKPRRDPIERRILLTASELRVARLATDGLTNREIAQALFVTEKTVEVHLTSTYRKLDIRSRSQLARTLPDAALAAA